MGNIGAPEIIVVLVLALLIFGPNRLPQLGRQIGRAMREFRQATSDLKADFDLALNEDDEPKQPAAAGAAAAFSAGSTGDAPADSTASAQTNLAGFAATLPAAVADGATESAAEPDAAEGAAEPDAADPALADAAVPEGADVSDDAEGAAPTTNGGS